MLVMKPLKTLTLPFQHRITCKPLAPEKLLVICIVEFFNYAVTPGFTKRNKNGLNAKVKAKANNQTWRPGVAVTSSKTEFIVELKKVRQPDRFPASEQTAGNLSIVFGSLWFNVNLMAIKIHHIERVKFAITFYISRANKIGLMNIVNRKRFFKIRVLNAFGNIRSFF